MPKHCARDVTWESPAMGVATGHYYVRENKMGKDPSSHCHIVPAHH